MSFFSKLLGLDKGLETVDNVANHIATGIDKATFTEQEKSQANLKLVDAQIRFMEAQGDENSVRSKTRRVLAIIIILPPVLYTLASAVLYKIDKDYSEHLLSLVTEWKWEILAVIGFYFGIQLLRAKLGAK